MLTGKWRQKNQFKVFCSNCVGGLFGAIQGLYGQRVRDCLLLLFCRFYETIGLRNQEVG